jgi:hypothetical protein
MTLACLLLAPGQVPGNPVALNQGKVRLPLTFDLARRQEISQVKLFASADRGLNWHEESVVAPEQEAIYFYAPRDGEYWLQVATISRQGKQEPDNVYKRPPERIVKVLIDTLMPVVRITSAQRQGSEIVVAWEIQEDHPDLASLKLEYVTAGAPSAVWVPAAAQPALIGQARVPVPGPQAVRLRLQMKDTAGNLSQAEADVAGPGGILPTAFTPQAQAAALLATPPAAPVVPPPAPVAGSLPRETASAAQPPPAPAPVLPPRTDSVAPPGPAAERAPRLVASSDTPPPPPTSAPAAPAAVPAPASHLPPLQVVNSTVLTMEYQLDKVGPSGVGSVEVWVTQDDGRTWQKGADDDEEIKKGSVSGGKYRRVLQLPGEGIYGFRLVVQSKAGLGDPPPKAGDLPEMRVEVDTTAPIAKLYEPVADPRQPNALLFRWECLDRNLAANPVTLEWAERREGPWQLIAPGLPNQPSQYSWQLPGALPVHVYLRLRVRDTAGNESVAVTPTPQLVDLSKPVGRLLSIAPTPGPH